MTDIIDRVTTLFQDRFEQLYDELVPKYPEYDFGAGIGYSSHGYNNPEHASEHCEVGINCIFPEGKPGVVDNVKLTVDLRYAPLPARIAAYVGWLGALCAPYDSGVYSIERVEASFPEDWHLSDDWPNDWPVATPEILEQMEAILPQLIMAFKEAVDRGHPDEQKDRS